MVIELPKLKFSKNQLQFLQSPCACAKIGLFQGLCQGVDKIQVQTEESDEREKNKMLKLPQIWDIILIQSFQQPNLMLKKNTFTENKENIGELFEIT